MYWFGFWFAILSAAVMVPISASAIPHVINHQGVLRDSNGDIVPDGNYSITFRMYDSPGPGGTLLWEELDVAPVTQGRFSVSLGSVTPIPESVFDAQPYLATQVDNDSEMFPRTRLTSVPYSFKSGDAETVSGVNVPDFLPPSLWSHAFREYVEIPNPPAEATVFTVPVGKTRYVTGIYCTMAYAVMKVDGVTVLTFNEPSGASASWHSGGGAPIVVASGQSLSIVCPLNPAILVTGYEF